jgi:hypothetical protein
MRKAITILATALLATSLFTAAAEARGGGGGGGGGHGGGFGGGHMGGFGGGAHIGGLGGTHMNGSGFHYQGMHRFGPRYGVYDGYGANCYYPSEAPKLPPWPPFCS